MTTPDAYVLRASNLPALPSAVSMSSAGELALADGTPVEFLWKPCIRVGQFEHPKLGKLNFTRDYLADVDRNTRQFIADGGKPYVPMGHSNKTNLGWIRETKFDGETLFGLHEMIGADAILAAKRNDSSVCIRNNFIGGNGRKYGPLLEHNCLTPEPVAMGLGDFVALSRDASGGPGEAVPIYSPAAEGYQPMLTPEQLAMAREILGETEQPVTEDNALDWIFQMARTARTLMDEVEETKVELSRATEQLEAQRVEMSRGVPPVVDAEALADRADAYMSRVELAAEKGDLPKFIAERMKAVVLPKGKPSVFMLSRSEDFDARPIDAVLELFAGSGLGKQINPPPGEVTRRQELYELSRHVPGSEGDGNAQPDRQAELLKQQLGTPAKVA